MRIAVFFSCISLTLLLAPGCRDRAVQPVSAAAAATSAAEPPAAVGAIAYDLLERESFVYWKGRPVGGKGHEGTIRPLWGRMALEASGQIVGAYFVLDMQSISSTDLKDGKEKRSLEAHLKDPDFFDVVKYPRASFLLTQALPGANDSTFTVSGRLTIKDSTHAITFPATIVRGEREIRATASLLIDRTRWGITYHSSSLLGLVKEGLLEDLVPVSLAFRFKRSGR